MKALYLLIFVAFFSNADQQLVTDKREILKRVYFNCREKSDIMTCVDRATTFGKQIGFDKKGDADSDLEMSLFFIVQDDLSSKNKK
jgi:hypothetical protein